MAQDSANFQSHGVGAGELEDDRAGSRAEGQDLQNTVARATLETPDLHRRHPVKGNTGQGALAMAFAIERWALPHEAVGDQDEALLVGQKRHLADRHQGILEKGRDDREILFVFGTQLELSPGPGTLRRRAVDIARHPGCLFGRTVAQPLDLCTAGGELVLETLVTAIEVVNATDHRLAGSAEPGEDKRNGGA